MQYLMLDKNNITKVCGTIETQELKKELNTTSDGVAKYVAFGKIFREKFILIEDNFSDRCSYFREKLLFENENGIRYYATIDGKFFSINKKNQKKDIQVFKQVTKFGEKLCVSLNNKTYIVKELINYAFH